MKELKIQQCNRNPFFLADFAYDGEFSDGNPFCLRIPERDILPFVSALMKAYVDDVNGEMYADGVGTHYLLNLFGDKCLPDKEESKLKFKVGDKVKVVGIVGYDGEITEVVELDDDPDAPYKLDLLDDEGGGIWCNENQIEPYDPRNVASSDANVDSLDGNVASKDAPRPHIYAVGQKVLNHYCKSEILTICELAGHADKNNPRYRVSGYPYLWNECELEFYTEEKKEPMEEVKDYPPYLDRPKTVVSNELNLCELLKGCEREEFYLLDCGNAILDGVQTNNSRGDSITFLSLHSTNFDSGTIIINPNGKRTVHGSVILYPSRALYEKYPLDSYSAWMEWKEARKPKRWRAKSSAWVSVSECEGHWEDYIYWYITSDGVIVQDEEVNCKADNLRYSLGNYFRSEELAKQAAEEVKECLMKFHDNPELLKGGEK